MKVDSNTLRQIAAMPVEAMTTTLLFLAGQLEQDERKRCLAAERQARYRNAHSNADVCVTEALQQRHSNAKITLSRVIDITSTSKQEESKKEEVKIISSVSSKPLSSDPAGFAEFWSKYPKRLGDADRKAAVKAFNAAIKRSDLQTIWDGTERYSVHCQETGKTGTEFVKQARTWLNADGWAETYERVLNGNHQPHHKLGTVADGFAKVRAVIAEAERRENESGGAFGQEDDVSLPRLWQSPA